MTKHRKPAQAMVLYFTLAVLCVGVLPASAQQLEQQAAQRQAPGSQESGQSNSVPVSAQSASDQPASDQNDEGKRGSRVFGVMPNELTVEGAKKVVPLSPGKKFKLVAEGAFDPYEFAVVGILAGIGQATNNTPEWGQGMKGYGIRYGTDLGDLVIGNFMVGAVLPSLFRQDPRYFQLGKGTPWHRAGYALSRIVVTRGDSGRAQFNVSEIAGNAIAGVISNSYHPPSGRSPGETTQTWGTQLAVDALGLELKEFWPDIRRRLHRKK